MEMVSDFYGDTTWVLYAIVAIAASVVGVIGFRWLDAGLRGQAIAEAGLRRLSEERVRTELSGFLRKQNVVGDADIRQGIVFAPVPPDRLEPLAQALGNAAAMLARLPNVAADVLYVRMQDGSMAMIDLDLAHLLDAARVMQRVAEDRRKSRSFYKGMTEEEMKGLTRAGMSIWLKDDGKFPESQAVMKGLWDDRPEFHMAMSVLELAFHSKSTA
jgi:hypothetical protein